MLWINFTHANQAVSLQWWHGTSLLHKMQFSRGCGVNLFYIFQVKETQDPSCFICNNTNITTNSDSTPQIKQTEPKKGQCVYLTLNKRFCRRWCLRIAVSDLRHWNLFARSLWDNIQIHTHSLTKFLIIQIKKKMFSFIKNINDGLKVIIQVLEPTTSVLCVKCCLLASENTSYANK